MITKTSYRDQVREHLQNQMLAGNLKAGQTLSLVGLARDLNVSVTPIREALTQLEQARIISAVPNRGFVISEIEAKEAKNIYELIGNLESLAIENSKLSATDLRQLEKAQDRFGRARTGIEKVKADFDFHRILTRNYDNSLAQQLIRDLKTRIFFYETSYMDDSGLTDVSDEQHLEIIELLKSGNQTKAAELIKTNWLIILQFIQKHLQKQQSMKPLIFVFLVLSGIFTTSGQIELDPKPVLRPKIFAEGVISTNKFSEFDITFAPDGKTAYFTRRAKGEVQKIYVSEFRDGGWSEPRLAPFSTDRDESPLLTPDGKTLYFSSTRPIPDRPSKGKFDMNVWKASKSDAGWSAPVPLAEAINKIQPENEEFPTASESLSSTIDGITFYYGTKKVGAKGIDLYRTQLRHGEFSESEKLTGEINSDAVWESSPSLSPDGNYLFFNIYGANGGFGKEDIYVSRKTPDGWSKPRNLGPLINSGTDEANARFSRDGRYFFYSRDDRKSETADEDWNLYFIETAALMLESLFEKEVIVRSEEITGDVANIKLNGQNFTGKVVEFFPDGRPKLWREVKDGLADGLWMEWLEDGNLRYRAYWKKGKGHGLWQYFHDNGTLRSEGFYTDDLAEGIHTEWHDNGQIKVKRAYRSNKLNGVITFYKPNGEVEKVEVYDDGKKIVQ